MKKLFVFSVLTVFTLLLTSCDLSLEEPGDTLSDEQLKSAIEEMLNEDDSAIEAIVDDILAQRDEENLLYLSESELESFITTLIPLHLSEEAIVELVESYLPNDLTEAELLALVRDLLPEDQFTSTFDLEGFEQASTAMSESRRDTVVGISTTTEEGGGSGSGVIYKAEGNEYYVVTNHHVIEDFTAIEIVYERYGNLNYIDFEDITFYGSDPITDLAVLSFTSDEVFQTVEFADSYALKPGQFVFAIGNPLGFQYFGSVTMGIISGSARFLESDDFNSTVIQHTAPISPGNSGGALFNINGELVGINHMKIIDDLAANMGFAIPSNTVQRIIRDLEESGVVIRPFLGVTSSVYVNLCDTDYGVCVDILEGGAAEAAGLINGDTIIGYKLEDWEDFVDVYNFNDLREAILNSRVGDRVIIKYIRDGVTYESDVTVLEVHPDDQ
ncbi:MAG: S1C family serine protease [Candidatus Izemoplasmataceae bacterium]